jgi:CYTH domain-containing protein
MELQTERSVPSKGSIVDTLVLKANRMRTVGIYARVNTDKQENGKNTDLTNEIVVLDRPHAWGVRVSTDDARAFATLDSLIRGHTTSEYIYATPLAPVRPAFKAEIEKVARKKIS